MSENTLRRTRFAPSPTGFMHIGNLRTALYAWLVARHAGGRFVLRIEDTDQERLIPGAVDIIYDTLRACGLDHDEGPDIGGAFAPYVQSERLGHYRPFAEQLLREGKAYRCFCQKSDAPDGKEDGAGVGSEEDAPPAFGYDRHCRDLSEEEIQARLAEGRPFVIRQKMPLTGVTHFYDEVYGDIRVENKELEDQILLKSDGFPTYNFANVVDDHEMGMTHVIRGSEYLSSTPKYNLLYEAFSWEIPRYIHLPLILGTDGKKLSKRHGATSFQDLLAEGYLSEAIVNYIAFLGWAPGQDTREIFSLRELAEVFDESHINKAPAVFDYEKLRWYNAQYIRAMETGEFRRLVEEACAQLFGSRPFDADLVAEILQPRLELLSQIPEMLSFVKEAKPFDAELFQQKKQKLTAELSLAVLRLAKEVLKALSGWHRQGIHDTLMALPEREGWKTGQVMGPLRIALSGQTVTAGGAVELLCLLGREESLVRLDAAIAILES